MSFGYDERRIQGEILVLMNEVIKEEELPFDGVEQEVSIKVQGMPIRIPDLILWEKREVKPAFLIELKSPEYDPWGDVLDDALAKANRVGIRYIATWNINRFYSWDLSREGTIYDKLWYPHKGVGDEVARIRSLSEFERVKPQIKEFLKSFLKEFSDVYYGVKLPPLMAIDERFIYWLRAMVDSLAISVERMFREKSKTDKKFLKGLKDWFIGQGWTFSASDEDFEKAARQYVYLLINKILFYYTLRMKYPELHKINIPKGIDGMRFKQILQTHFDRALEKDYLTIFAANFLDAIPPPDAAVDQLRNFILRLGEHDFEKMMRYEVLGRVFERLIPSERRHELGQYFTRGDVVNFIVGFSVKSPDDKVLDGGVGAGTFLVRAYERKRFLNPAKRHKDLLKELYGVDIAKFPAHIATINLAVKDLSEPENHPCILNRDFFDIRPGSEEYLIQPEYVPLPLSKRDVKVKIPYFDAVVMNPPYTRQEEMEEILEKEKEKAYKVCIEDWMRLSGKYSVDEPPKLSKRSSIYVYFFIHGASFLKEGGRMGLITSNSWLDVDYGYDLQKFFLENFKIIAVIESKVERWFEDADINTVITILERCSNEDERNKNVVRFVYLKRPLRELIPPLDDERAEWESVQSLINKILSKDAYYEDEAIRVFPKLQKELLDEGYDEEEKEYVGSKWGKYIRAPDIFFKILEKGKGILVPLKEVAEVRRGFTTGANEFFYLTEEEIQKWGIEREFWMHPLRKEEEIPVPEHVWKDKNGEYFKASQYTKRMRLEDVLRDDGYVYWVPNYVIKSPRECKSILVNPKSLKYRVLLIHKDKSELRRMNVLKYIKWGESQGFHLRPTCASRQKWYELNEIQGALLCMMSLNDRYIFWLNDANSFIDARLYGISLKETHGDKDRILSAILNSSFIPMFVELLGRVNLGQGALDVKVYEYGKMPIINFVAVKEGQIVKIDAILNSFLKRGVGSVFEEIGAKLPEEVSLDKVKPDRRELDKIIMGEILGLTDEEQLEVYKAVVDLVKARIERAESVKKRKKTMDIDIEALVDSALKDVKGFKRFPEDFVQAKRDFKVVELPEGAVKAGSDLHGYYVQVGEEKIRCNSPEEAMYIQYAAGNGHRRIEVPLDDKVLKNAVKEYSKLLKDVEKIITEFVESSISSKKLREKVKREAWRRLGIHS